MIFGRPAPRALWLLGMLAVAAYAGACSDPFRMTAQFTNATQPFTVHALTGTPTYFATALSVQSNTTTKVDGSFSFDVAFDIDPSGNIVFLPPHMVGENPLGNRRVGLLKSTSTYTNLTEAPLDGYVYDSVTVAPLGVPVVIQAPSSSCSIYGLPNIYAKVVIDSVDTRTRTMWGRSLVDLNCTFRSLSEGMPTF